MRNIKLIALDLDGTLLNMEKKVPQGNYQALKECEKAGIQIVPATGRGVGGIPPTPSPPMELLLQILKIIKRSRPVDFLTK